MSQIPSKFMTVLPGFIHAVGAVMMILGTGYGVAAQNNPDISSTLGWSASLLGVLSTLGGFMVSNNNTTKAAAASPEPPKGVDGITNILSIAAGKAMDVGDHELVHAIANAAAKRKEGAK